MLVMQAFDGAPISEVPTDDEASLQFKLERAAAALRMRKEWLQPYRRIEVLKRLALLVHRNADDFALLIAREGGKPLTDAVVEVKRPISGVEGAIADLHYLAGHLVPMGIKEAARDRWAFTTRPPAPVAAISSFHHPLNLIIYQVVPAIAGDCPVSVKPAVPTPLCCLKFLSLFNYAGSPL